MANVVDELKTALKKPKGINIFNIKKMLIFF